MPLFRRRFLVLALWVLNTLGAYGGLIPVGAKINRLPVGLKEFHEVEVISVNPESMTLKHSMGIDQVRFEDLEPSLRERLGYDPGKAAAYREQIERERVENERFEAARRARNQAILDRGGNVAKKTAPVHIHRDIDMRSVFRNFDTVTKDQGRRPSCSVFSVVCALEYEFFRISETDERLSEEFLIWATMTEVGGLGKVKNAAEGDAGFAIQSVLRALMKYGVASAVERPNRYGVSIHDVERPEPFVLESARTRRSVISVQTILGEDGELKVNTVMKALNRLRPVVVGMMFPPPVTLRSSFVLDSQRHHIEYSHAVTLVGYSNETGALEDTRFIFKNSWGLEWGNRGYGIVSYHYLVNYLRDAFVLEVVGMEPSKTNDIAPSASAAEIEALMRRTRK